jgi:hypothetical protein
LPVEKDALQGPVYLAALAEIEARTGQAKEAIKILRRLITSPAGGAVSIARLKIDPVWDPIRDNPDFQKTHFRTGAGNRLQVAAIGPSAHADSSVVGGKGLLMEFRTTLSRRPPQPRPEHTKFF